MYLIRNGAENRANPQGAKGSEGERWGGVLLYSTCKPGHKMKLVDDNNGNKPFDSEDSEEKSFVCREEK